MEQNLTTGNVWKQIARFSLPYLLSYFLQTLYGMADLFIIGQFEGAAGTTAVSVGSQVMHMITVMIVGLAMGSTVSIAQAVGAGKREQVSRSVGNTITLFMGVSVVLSLVLWTLAEPLTGVLSTPADAVQGTIRYLTICFLGIPFITAYNIISSIFRGMGDSKSPMYFIAVACAVNIVLDYLFMGMLHMGPAGAALGTTLSQAVSVLLALIVIIREKRIAVQKNHLRPDRETMGQLLQIGIPVALQDGLIQIAFIVITVIANKRGLSQSAAVGIVEKIISFLFLVPSSMLSAVSALCAQNIGAGKPKRARETLRCAIMITAGFGIAAAIFMQFAAELVVGMFTADRIVRIMGGQYLRGYIFDCFFAGIHFCFSGYFCACGRSEFSFLHNIMAIVLVRIPGVYLTSVLFPQTLFPMGIATSCGSLLSVVICLIVYAWLRRKDRENPLVDKLDTVN